MTDSKQFCDACYTLFFEQPSEGSDRHHGSGKELERCAESRSCSLCANLWSKCSDKQQADVLSQGITGELDGEKTYIQCSYHNDLLRFTLPIALDDSIEMPFKVAPLGFQTLTDVNRRKLNGKTFSRNTTKLAKQWVDSCISWHAHSKLSPILKLHPTRLIEVGSVEAPVLRICETKTFSEKVRYIVLSHRWIEGKIHTLLHSNIEAYKGAIPSELLSNNFNDAIAVTRMLGIGYLWIDSLCIIQDSKTDWAAEAVRMADYYEYAYCTLSATSSTEYDRGLIMDRDPNVILPTFYDLRRPEPEQKSILGKVIKLSLSAVKSEAQPKSHLLPLGRYVLLDPRSWYREVDASILNTRAWCYQERLLSSRILHFCKTRIFFECLDSRCSEDHPHGIEKDVFAQDVKTNSPQARLLKLKEYGESDVAKLAHSIWAGTVSQYSERTFTFASDRLVAISSIAKRYKELMSLQKRSTERQIECCRKDQKLPDYFMGIWLCNEYTVSNLCWSTMGSLDSRPAQLQATTPSWSFGSVVSEVTFGVTQGAGSTIDETTELASIVKVDADFKIGHSFEDAMWTGLLNQGAGAIWLEGPLLPVTLSTKVIEEAAASTDSRSVLVSAGTWDNHPLLVIGDEVQKWGWQADALRTGSSKDNHGWSGQYFAMALCVMPSQKQFYGIILEWVDQGSGCYRRVGSFSWEPDIEAALHRCTARVEADGMDPKFYEARADKGRVRVKVI